MYLVFKLTLTDLFKTYYNCVLFTGGFAIQKTDNEYALLRFDSNIEANQTWLKGDLPKTTDSIYC